MSPIVTAKATTGEMAALKVAAPPPFELDAREVSPAKMEPVAIKVEHPAEAAPQAGEAHHSGHQGLLPTIDAGMEPVSEAATELLPDVPEHGHDGLYEPGLEAPPADDTDAVPEADLSMESIDNGTDPDPELEPSQMDNGTEPDLELDPKSDPMEQDGV